MAQRFIALFFDPKSRYFNFGAVKKLVKKPKKNIEFAFALCYNTLCFE